MANKKEKIFLEKEFSREKTLGYAIVWDVSERMGYKDFLGYDFKNSLFVYDPKIKKTAVWHDPKASEQITRLVFAKNKKNKNFANSIIKRLDENWKIIFPYLAKKKKIKTAGEFIKYYQGLIFWWSAMNTVYPLIENQDISKEVGNKFFKYRQYSQYYTDMMDTVIREFLQKFLEKQFKKLADYLSIEEALALASGKMNKGEIKKVTGRKKGFFIQNTKIFSADLLKSILKKNNIVLSEAIPKKYQEIKGVSAFRGVVRGIVKKVIVKRDIYDFGKGEVLVAEMTSPSHVSMMKKAAAIITDEGGITCHAAIIARELKKPCIIGTKIATKVLKDGDLVEVDADKGIVRIINT